MKDGNPTQTKSTRGNGKMECVEGGHRLPPELEMNAKDNTVRIGCVVCGLVYINSEDVKYSMKLLDELRLKNLKEVN